jgi:hypothetical protein
MREEESPDSGFPGIAFATLPNTGETVAIRYSERIYYRVDTKMTADELNAVYGVTEAQANAILASVLTTWETSSVNRENQEPQKRRQEKNKALRIVSSYGTRR